jgi:hypothetical protein
MTLAIPVGTGTQLRTSLSLQRFLVLSLEPDSSRAIGSQGTRLFLERFGTVNSA